MPGYTLRFLPEVRDQIGEALRQNAAHLFLYRIRGTVEEQARLAVG